MKIPHLNPRCRFGNAFTLVEVVLALGVAAFALTSIFGLLPVGLQSLRTSMEMNVGAVILQRISGLAAQSDFKSLDTLSQNTLYFDDQGSLVTGASQAIYEVALDNPELVSGLEGSEEWPLFSKNLKRMTVHIRYANRPAATSAIRSVTLLLGNNGG